MLVVDDEAAILDTVKNALLAHGYRVLLAADGTEALKVFARKSRTIAAVLTDIMMPLMDGVALIKALRRMQPALPIIASTGLREKTRFSALAAFHVNAVLNKPYRTNALLHAVHEALHPATAPQKTQ